MPRFLALGRGDTQRLSVFVFLGGLLLLVSGCSQGASARYVSPVTRTEARTVTADVATYASVVGLSLKLGVEAGSTLLAEMRSSSPDTLATVCSTSGEQFSEMYDTFRRIPAPAGARPVAARAVTGFKVLLSAIDECGMAADGVSRSQMSTAARDMSYALWQMTSAQTVLTRWAFAAH